MLVVVLVGSIAVTSVVAKPVLGTVTITPEQPQKGSTVTFTVEVTGTDIQSVYLGVLECNEQTGVCENRPDNVSMAFVSGSTYRAEVTLNYPTATYMTYWVYVHSEGNWTTLPDADGEKVTLATTPDNNQTNGDGDSNGTPGFEVVPLLAAVGIAALILRRKRS
jgi:hypothetical protein